MEESAVVSSRDETKNDFNLLLYEYQVDTNEIDLILGRIKNKAIAKYNFLDSCVLIVNRFETESSKYSLETPIITDSTLINRICYDKKYPIPNFIGFHENDMNRDSKLDNTFTIYVLDANRADSWGTEFAMEPAPQMPNNWKNGYSKGIAISRKHQTIIYWTVIW